jgi:hypothetical protein
MLKLVRYQEMSTEQLRGVLELRNGEAVRKASLRTESIGWEEHLAWVESLGDECRYWGVYGERLLGILNVTRLEGVPRWGIVMTGGPAIAVSCWLLDQLFARYEAVESLVKRDNARARAFNERLGLREVGEESGAARMRIERGEWPPSETIFDKIRNRYSIDPNGSII